MKTLETIYTEVLADEALTARFQALKTPEEQAAFVKELGGEASAEEIAEFLAKKSGQTGELTDEELDQVVGGKSSGPTYIHDTCGGQITYHGSGASIYNVGYYRCDQCGEQHARKEDFAYHEA